MIDQLWKKFLGGLNLQFIAYFLLFAYVPLLTFSIIGYALNKRMIYQVNKANVETLTQKTAVHLRDYLKLKKEKIKYVFSAFADEDEWNAAAGQLSEMNSIAIWHTGELFPVKNISDTLQFQLINRVPVNTPFFNYGPQKEFFLTVMVEPNFVVWASIPADTIRSIIRSNDSATQFCFCSQQNEFHIHTKPPVRDDGLFSFWPILSFIDKTGDLEYRTHVTTNLNIVAKRPAYIVYGELKKFMQEIVLANLIIGILMLAIAILLARRIAGPIQELVGAANKFSQGDLSSPVHVRGIREINILSDEFEVMRQKLLELHSGMEEKIEERTQALRDAQFQISHQEKMASLGLLAAGVAHEIGNPLTGISSMAQLIRRKIKDEDIQGYLKTILSNIERISRIVRELVDFARPTSYEATDVDVNRLIQSAVSIVRYDKRAKNMRLELKLDAHLPAVHLVEDQLQQVFLNILINAVDACHQSTSEIKIRSFTKSGNLYVRFSDNGIGIAKENLPKIFEPFFTTKKVGKGTGLGLSVSYGIIKNLGGTISVESIPFKGSTFTIEIPLEQTEQIIES